MSSRVFQSVVLQLKESTSRTIGVILPPSAREVYENPFYLEMIRGINQFCNAHQYVSTIITGGIDYDFANMLCHAGIEVVAGVEGSAREVLEAYINHTLIGADELCHTLAFNNDEEEAEVDDAFAKLEANFFTANA